MYFTLWAVRFVSDLFPNGFLRNTKWSKWIAQNKIVTI